MSVSCLAYSCNHPTLKLGLLLACSFPRGVTNELRVPDTWLNTEDKKWVESLNEKSEKKVDEIQNTFHPCNTNSKFKTANTK
jgi:hypothetical protein